MSTLLRWSGAAAVVALSACILPELGLEGRPCPCAEGWTCDPATDTCVQDDVDPVTTTTTTTVGPGSTSGSSTSQTSASQSTGEGGGPVGPGGGGGSTADGGGGSGAGDGGGPTSTSASSSASTGEGGGDPCDGLAPSVAPCGGVVATFGSSAELDDLWDVESGGPQNDFLVVGGSLTIQLVNEGPAYVETQASFDLEGCAIWTRLVQVTDDPGVVTRLSYGDPGDGFRHGVSVLDGMVEARSSGMLLDAIPYDAVAMEWLRLRGQGGVIHFGTSSDGMCWDEFHAQADVATGVTGRLVLDRVSGSNANAESTFDDYGASP